MKILRRLLKLLKGLGLVVLSLLGIAVVLLTCAIIWPNLFINEKTARWAIGHFAPHEMAVRWEQLYLHVDSPSLLKRNLLLRSKKLCVTLAEEGIRVCMPQVHLSIDASFSRLIPKIIQGVFQGHGQVVLADRSQVNFKVLLNWDGPYRINARFVQARTHSSILLNSVGFANLNRVTGELSVVGKGWIQQAPRMELQRCHLYLGRESLESAHKFYDLNLNCPLKAFVALGTGKISDLIRQLRIPSDIGGRLAVAFHRLSLPSSQTSGQQVESDGSVVLNLEPTGASPVRLGGRVEINGKGSLADLPSQWQAWDIQGTIVSNVQVPQFEEVVNALETGPWGIPAPFNVLKGDLNFRVEGQGDIKKGDFLLNFKTRMTSQVQAMDIDSIGKLQLTRQDLNGHEKRASKANQASQEKRANSIFIPNLEAKVLLKDVRLQLPQLSLNVSFPRFLPDPRINVRHFKKVEITTPPSDLGLKYHVTIETPPKNPVKILTNLASAPIPIQLHLEMNSSDSQAGALGGWVRVDQFPVEVFRRRAIVEHFGLDLRTPVKESPVNGLVRVDLTDYQLMLRVSSVLEKPQVKFTSDPPLPENQLIAALLFGLPVEDLSADQASSVGSTRAAVADGALNLLSMYVLASTPVQSVGYDPSSGVVSAKLRLGEGTSLNLGTDAKETATVGVRKRLGPYWTIETDLSRTADSGQVATAYLEWSHRY